MFTSRESQVYFPPYASPIFVSRYCAQVIKPSRGDILTSLWFCHEPDESDQESIGSCATMFLSTKHLGAIIGPRKTYSNIDRDGKHSDYRRFSSRKIAHTCRKSASTIFGNQYRSSGNMGDQPGHLSCGIEANAKGRISVGTPD